VGQGCCGRRKSPRILGCLSLNLNKQTSHERKEGKKMKRIDRSHRNESVSMPGPLIAPQNKGGAVQFIREIVCAKAGDSRCPLVFPIKQFRFQVPENVNMDRGSSWVWRSSVFLFAFALSGREVDCMYVCTICNYLFIILTYVYIHASGPIGMLCTYLEKPKTQKKTDGRAGWLSSTDTNILSPFPTLGCNL
jgi:hypothetical protein